MENKTSVCLVAGPRGLSAQGPISLTPTFCIDALHPCVSTYHNDNSRDGVNPNETTFTPTTNFANLTHVVYPTDGLIYAQPLYIKSLDSSNHRIGICNAPANIVFVATENNSVYAFDTTPPVSPKPLLANKSESVWRDCDTRTRLCLRPVGTRARTLLHGSASPGLR